MKKLLIYHVWADENMGDLAITSACASAVKMNYPTAEVTGMSAFSKSDFRFHQSHKKALETDVSNIVPAIFPLPVRGVKESGIFFKIRVAKQILFLMWLLLITMIFKHRAVKLLSKTKESFLAIADTDIIAINGGGFFYGFRGVKGTILLLQALYGPVIAMILGKKVISFPHSFGPFEGSLNKWLARTFLSKANAVMVREPKSVGTLNNIGVSKNLIPCTDIAFLMQSKHSDRVKELASFYNLNSTSTLKVGLTARPWHFPDCDKSNREKLYSKYIDSMVSTVNYVYTELGVTIMLIPQVTFGLEDDRIALREINEKAIKGSTILIDTGEISPNELKALYSYLDVLIGTRMHSVIFASAEKVPCIAISYHGTKAPGIMADLGMEKYALNINNLNEKSLKELMAALLKEREFSKKIITENIMEMKEQLIVALKTAFEA